jgi:hypothetical protein
LTGSAILLAVLFAIGFVVNRFTNARLRHQRLHPHGLNSGPDRPPSILSTDDEESTR